MVANRRNATSLVCLNGVVNRRKAQSFWSHQTASLISCALTKHEEVRMFTRFGYFSSVQQDREDLWQGLESCAGQRLQPEHFCDDISLDVRSS